MFETALKYVLSLLIENEEVQKFPKEFVASSVKWVRSWFLIDDPAAEAVVKLPGNEDAKKAVIEAKLPKLLEDEKFVKELEAQIQTMQIEREKLPGTVITNTATIGDSNHNTATIQGSTIGGQLDITQS
jgi:hypothetical protein